MDVRTIRKGRLTLRRFVVSLQTAGVALLFGLPLSNVAATDQGSDDLDPRNYGFIGTPIRRLAIENEVQIDVLLDQSISNSESIEIAEITFFPNATVIVESPSMHTHDVLEIFYVLAGTLVHTVGENQYHVKPGQLAYVRSGDKVAHGVASKEAVKALVIWIPGGELARLARFGFVEI